MNLSLYSPNLACYPKLSHILVIVHLLYVLFTEKGTKRLIYFPLKIPILQNVRENILLPSLTGTVQPWIFIWEFLHQMSSFYNWIFFWCAFCTTSGPPRDRMGLPVGKMEPQQVEMYLNPTKHAPIKVLKIIIETISC